MMSSVARSEDISGVHAPENFWQKIFRHRSDVAYFSQKICVC
nr:MAG TPA: hypothetical protein [Caudoviricetes sp.]